MKLSKKPLQKLFQFKKFNFASIDYSFDTKDFLQKTESYEKQILDRKNEFTFEVEKLKGYATSEGTKAYSLSNKEEGINV